MIEEYSNGLRQIYTVEVQKTKMAFLLLFCLSTLSFLTYMAFTNDTGLIISMHHHEVISFGVFGAAIFYAILAVFVLVGLITLIISSIETRFYKREVILTNDAIICPEQWRLLARKIVIVNYLDIKNIELYQIHGNRMITIKHKDGTINIPDTMFSKKTFTQLYETMSELYMQAHQETVEKLVGKYEKLLNEQQDHL